jgi:hypothetical protein
MRRVFGLFGAQLALIFAVGIGLTFLAVYIRDAHAQGTGPVYCGQQATLIGFTTKATVIAAPAGGTAQIYICGYSVSAVAASVVTFQAGTGAACATTSAATGNTIELGVTSTVIDSSPVWRGWALGAGNELCVTGTTTSNIQVYYAFGN